METTYEHHPSFAFQFRCITDDPIYRESDFGQRELIELRNMNNRWHHILEHCKGDPIGVQLAHKHTENRWCQITTETSGPATVTLRYFDECTFTTIVNYDSASAALADAVSNGYWTIDNTALSRISSTKKWKIGQARADIIRMHNSGEISLIELVNRFNQIDQELEGLE